MLEKLATDIILAPLGIMAAHLRAPLKPLNTVMFEGFQEVSSIGALREPEPFDKTEP